MTRRRLDDVIVLLPGITGSVLQKDGHDVWAMNAGAAWRALKSLGRNIQTLRLDEDPDDVDDIGDGVVATRVMPDISIIPGLWKIDGYTKIADRIKAEFEVEEGLNFFPFAYDWRRSNRVAARKLARESHEWLRTWRERGHPDAKLILVGHSMGGLVSRYFLECMDGWRDTRMLVTFGTPYQGSLNALGFVANGMSKRVAGITLVDLSKLLRSFTSVYQLLPSYKVVDTGAGAGSGAGSDALRTIADVDGIPNLDPARAKAAFDFHAEIAAAAARHADDADYRERGYLLRPVVGMFQSTKQSASLAGGRVELLETHHGVDDSGDGTVPRVSATPLEHQGQQIEVYISDRHASLQNNDPVLTQLVGLLSAPGIDTAAYYATHVRLNLEVDDLHLAGEPIPLRVQPENQTVKLTATVTDTASGATVAHTDLAAGDDGWHRSAIAPLPEGSYRVTVAGQHGVDPVTDLFAVTSAAEEG